MNIIAKQMKTAEEYLNKAYDEIKAKQSSYHEDVDPVLLNVMKQYAKFVANKTLQDAADTLDKAMSDLTQDEYNIIVRTYITTP